MKNPILIAIDGTSASGKGSLAQKLALHFDLAYLNTGALYRAVAWRLVLRGFGVDDFLAHLDELVFEIEKDDLENEELFSEKIGAVASKIAKNQLLRDRLFDFQREFIAKGIEEKGGVVLDGRDIASKIMPEANHKFFVTADVEIRAKRRFLQLGSRGENISYDEILAQLKKRDENDKNRATSPLVIDEDATIIDNSEIDADQTFAAVLEAVNSKN